jgi:hypothetical protein
VDHPSSAKTQLLVHGKHWGRITPSEPLLMHWCCCLPRSDSSFLCRVLHRYHRSWRELPGVGINSKGCFQIGTQIGCPLTPAMYWIEGLWHHYTQVCFLSVKYTWINCIWWLITSVRCDWIISFYVQILAEI